MYEHPIESLSKVLERIRDAMHSISDEEARTLLKSIDSHITDVLKEIEAERELHLNPLPTGESCLEVLDSMDRFAARHWMHEEGQNVKEFANRMRKAYLAEKRIPK